jgi:hypothetical protein
MERGSPRIVMDNVKDSLHNGVQKLCKCEREKDIEIDAKHHWITVMLGGLEKLNRVKPVAIKIRRMLGKWNYKILA